MCIASLSLALKFSSPDNPFLDCSCATDTDGCFCPKATSSLEAEPGSLSMSTGKVNLVLWAIYTAVVYAIASPVAFCCGGI